MTKNILVKILDNVRITRLTVFLLFLSGISSVLYAEKILKNRENFLFMGNSFTFRHNLKDLFKAMAEEGWPGLKVYTEKITYGGKDLFRHHDIYYSSGLVRINSISRQELQGEIKKLQELSALSSAPPFYIKYWEKIGKRKPGWKGTAKGINRAIRYHKRWLKRLDNPTCWDYLVLQSWRDVVDKPDTGYVKYAKIWAKLAKKEKIEVVLYITAPFTQNATPVKKAKKPDQVFMEMRVVHKLAKQLNAVVVPVPLAIYLIQKKGTDLTFRYKNDGHPNQYCAYLTSCLFYAAIYNKSPVGLKFNEVTETKNRKKGVDPDGGPLKVVFSDKTKSYLQEIAWKAVRLFKKGKFR